KPDRMPEKCSQGLRRVRLPGACARDFCDRNPLDEACVLGRESSGSPPRSKKRALWVNELGRDKFRAIAQADTPRETWRGGGTDYCHRPVTASTASLIFAT